jgi:hypothetical protein
MNFEPVHEVSEYYDGPRAGIALFNGDRYRFRSRFLDVTECKGDFESVDIFELARLNHQSVGGSWRLRNFGSLRINPSQKQQVSCANSKWLGR